MSGSVLYLVTEPWYFVNHRLDHARALLADGLDVGVATRTGDRLDELIAAGCAFHEIDVARGTGSLRSWVSEIRSVRRIVRRSRPDVVHAVALKPVALALSLLPMRRRPALILSVNGLGLSAAQRGPRMRVIRTVVRASRRMPRVTLLFQTRADQRALLGDDDAGVVIPGVGVDTTVFVPGERSTPPPVRIVYLGRAVASKGLSYLADAYAGGELGGVEVALYCTIDASSPGALDDATIERLRSTPGISLHPATRDAAGVLAHAHGAILPSVAGEGVSKFVLEALASGTPLLLSAQSGSGEVIEEGVTGVQFAAGDPASIAAALADFARWTPERWAAASAACRASAEANYSLRVILPRIVELHRSAIAAGARR